jgi:hypothetical protein
VQVGARTPVPQVDDRSTDARSVVAVDDGDDEPGGLKAQRRPRRRAMEAERGPERVRLRLVPAAAGGGEPGQEKKQDP